MREEPSDNQGTSASLPTKRRPTKNSNREGQLLSSSIDTRARAQEPIIQRVQNRVSASQAQAAARNKPPRTSFDLSQLSDLSEPPDSPESTMPTSTTNPSASSTSGNQNPRGTSSNPRDDQDPQTNPNVPMPTSTRKMPKPGEKNAPAFNPERPEELGRFFERMEDWFADEGIVSDVDKKRRIVRYLDADSEIQWKALPVFTDGTFEEFRKEVMASYPKAEEMLRGSVSALKKKILKLGPVAADDRDELLTLVRIMTAEVQKLKRITPPIHTNRELVELFLGRLTPDFAARVANKLSVHRLLGTDKQAEDPPARNTEDMYDIEDVMKMAKHTSLEHANPFGKFLRGVPGIATETNVKLEEAVARLSDSIKSQTHYNQQVEQRLASMHTFLSQSRPPTAQPGYNRGLAPSNSYVNSGSAPTCFYCRGLHRVAECEQALQHLDLGWVVKIDNHLRLPDGRSIPRDGVKTMKEVVEAMNKPKGGIIPISKVPDKAALYQDSARLSSYAQSQVTEEDSVRALTELIQKIGVDKVQRMLSAPTSESLEVEGEWEQNFELVQ